MNSQVTLVSPAPPVSYFLSSTNLTNTVIYCEPAVPLYRVSSDERHMKVYDSKKPNHLIAVFHRRHFFSDTISFPSGRGAISNTSSAKADIGKRVKVERWLKQSKVPDKTATFTVDTEYGPYVWKASRDCHEVFVDHDPKSPVASCYLQSSLPSNRPAFVLQSAAEPLRDVIVIAYLVQRYRMILESKCSPSTSIMVRSLNTTGRMLIFHPFPGILLAPSAYLLSG